MPMEGVKGKLCDVCMSIFEDKKAEWSDNPHHKNIYSLLASRDIECFICTLLWAKIQLSGVWKKEIENADHILNSERLQTYYCEFWKKKHERTLEFRVLGSPPHICQLRVQLSRRYRMMRSKRELKTRPWSALDPNIGSSQSLQKIHSWLSSCGGNHEYCRPHSEAESFFPTRVVDVTKVHLGIVSLRMREEAESEAHQQASPTGSSILQGFPTYWTLSHRWGEPSKLPKLVKEHQFDDSILDKLQFNGNIPEHRFRNGIYVSNLSPTFRDAVSLVRRLGYSYIWIDSLCIHQDSEEDWQREARTVADIYRHSFCNISAMSSSFDPSVGLFRQRRFEARLLYPFVVDGSILGEDHSSWIAYDILDRDTEIKDAPLSSRGWVVQEQFLSTRVLHFTRTQIYWECLEGTGCETDHAARLPVWKWAKQMDRMHGNYKKMRLHLAKTKEFMKGRQPEPDNEELEKLNTKASEYWGMLVKIYASCLLTKESDRFIAMSGIAQVFREINVYFHDSDMVQRRESYAPSWSWASAISGNTTIELPKLDGCEVISLIRLVGKRIETEPPGGDPIGMLQYAELYIEGILYNYRWVAETRTLELYTDEDMMNCIYTKHEHDIGFQLDTQDLEEEYEDEDDMEGVCVPVCHLVQPYQDLIMILSLQRDSLNIFRRIGYIHISAGPKDKELAIVGRGSTSTRITLI
ncbi:heterokaryon incompatibility protein-domain-containing protein [Hypoxylon sp. NC1633]|nr:heterokaryon incompatibility protein-domain-containing protein [Hypoxylon sp. NC1633]